jgi:hypothetical protein
MSDVSERGGELPEPGQLIDMVQSLQSGGSFVFLQGRLYREVEVKHPRNARFSLKNEQGLFFVKVYQATLVELARSLEPGTELGVVGEMHSFVNRRCRNHHVFIRAAALFPLTDASADWTVRIENSKHSYIIGSNGPTR